MYVLFIYLYRLYQTPHRPHFRNVARLKFAEADEMRQAHTQLCTPPSLHDYVYIVTIQQPLYTNNKGCQPY
jgi:hypothetical protein